MFRFGTELQRYTRIHLVKASRVESSSLTGLGMHRQVVLVFSSWNAGVDKAGFVLFLNLYKEIPWLFSTQPCTPKRPTGCTSEYYQEYHILSWARMSFFYGIFPFSMTSDIFKDFHDFSRPGNQSFRFHDFSRFSMTAWTLIKGVSIGWHKHFLRRKTAAPGCPYTYKNKTNHSALLHILHFALVCYNLLCYLWFLHV